MSKRVKNVGVLFSLVLLLSSASLVADITVSVGGKTTTVKTAQIEVATGQTGVAVFTSEELQYLSKSGEPQIPWKMMTVLLPPDADMATVSCSIASVEYETLEGIWDVSPAPPILSRDADGNEITIWPVGKTIVDGRDTDIYSADALWPREDVQLTGTGKLRDWKLAEIAVPLILYNPLSGELQRLVHAEILVDCDKESVAATRSALTRSAVTGKRRGRDRAAKLTVNFDGAVAAYGAAQGGTESTQKDTSADGGSRYPGGTNGYAIITTNAIRAASTKLAAFVTHKQSMGFTVTVIDEDETGATTVGDAAATKLREWLQANYIALDLKYALIIGDPTPANGYVPMKISCGSRNIPTDYHYAELTCDWDKDGDGIIGEMRGAATSGDELERYFEVYVGRIPYYGVIADTDAILQKTIDYETSTDTDWRRRTLISAVPMNSGLESYDWGEMVKSDILEPNAISNDRVYRNGYGHYVTDYDILPPPEHSASAYPATVWSQGQYGLHVWFTHGWSKGASGIIDVDLDVHNLDDDHPTTTFQASCQNAWPEAADNLSYSILKNGGIVTIGATRVSWFDSGRNYRDTPSLPGLSYRYAKGVIEGKSCGETLWNLKEETTVWWDHNWTLFNAYGDPSVVVMVNPPAFTIKPTDRFYTKQYDGETLVLDSRTYTLENDSASALSWTASKTASWFDLSSSGGSIPANSSVTVNVTLNSGIESLQQDTYTDTITFTDTTNGKTLLRGVEYVLSRRVARTDYEAEDAAYSGPAFSNSQPGYSGTGYLDYANASNDYIEWTINAASDGPYTLAFRYALSSGDRPLELKVDGDVVKASLSFPSTGSWSSWKNTEEVIVTLTAGSHTVRTTAIGSSGGNVDLLRVYDGLNLEDIDAYARGGSHGDDNFGSAATLDVKYDSTNHAFTRESYLRFNCADTTDPIRSANLILTPASLQTGGGTTVMAVRLLDDPNDSWVENEITYNNRPQGTGLEATFTKGALQVGTPHSIDVTSLVNQAINTNKVASFQIVSNAAYHVAFHSQEAEVDQAFLPKLEIIIFLPADINTDGSVNLLDFAMLAEHWADMDCSDGTPCGRADVDGDNNIDLVDLKELAEHWLQ